MANIDSIKKKYYLEGDSYRAADADAAISDLFVFSRKLALQNREMTEKIAALEAERDELAAFKKGEAEAAENVRSIIEKADTENEMLRSKLEEAGRSIAALKNENSALAENVRRYAEDCEKLAAAQEKLTEEKNALEKRIADAGNIAAVAEADLFGKLIDDVKADVSDGETDDEAGEVILPVIDAAGDLLRETAATDADMPDSAETGEAVTEDPAGDDRIKDELRRVLGMGEPAAEEKKTGGDAEEFVWETGTQRTMGDMKSRLASIRNKNR